jgi:hypothetical protein
MKLCKNVIQIGCQILEVIVKVIKVVNMMMMTTMILDPQRHRKAEKGEVEVSDSDVNIDDDDDDDGGGWTKMMITEIKKVFRYHWSHIYTR